MHIRHTMAALVLGLALTPLRAHAQTFSLYTLETENAAELNKVQDSYEIVGRDGKVYEIYVPLQKAKAFQLENPKATLVTKDVDAEWKANFKTQERFATGYHDWQAIQDYMTNAVQNYPDLATKVVYGQTKQNRELSYLRLTSPNKTATPKPKIFLDAATHGDELISTEVLLGLVTEVLGGYGKDDRLTRMLEETEIFVTFVVNPDGFVNQNRYEGWVDPNRSYPWPGDPDKKASPSIQALIDLFAKEKFDGSMTFHAYGKLLMYPWGYTRDPIEDEADRVSFETLTGKLALENNYTYGSIAETIYVARGSSADYYYWKHGTKALAVELSTSKVPPASRIPSVVNETREMVWTFIEAFYPNSGLSGQK